MGNLQGVNIFTDGSCPKNDSTGPGGYCAILTVANCEAAIEEILKDEMLADMLAKQARIDLRKTGLRAVIRVVLGHEPISTNNRMELMAAISGIEALDPGTEATLFSDAKYVTEAVNEEWLSKWQKNGWKSASGPVKNRDLWERLLRAKSTRRIMFRHVAGHTGNADLVSRMNAICDELARSQVSGLTPGGLLPPGVATGDCM